MVDPPLLFTPNRGTKWYHIIGMDSQNKREKIRNSYVLFVSVIISTCLWRPCQQQQDTDCLHRCGNIDIPYPFGIGPVTDRCYLNPNFAVSCNSSSSLRIPVLIKFNLEILEVRNSISYEYGLFGDFLVKVPSVSACNGTNTKWSSLNLEGTPFSFGFSRPGYPSYGPNIFASVGCEGYASFDDGRGVMVEGCTSVCAADLKDGLSTLSSEHTLDQCYGFNNCCQIDIPLAQKYSISLRVNNGSGYCRSAFLISREHLATHALNRTTIVSVTAAVPVILLWHVENHDEAYERFLFAVRFVLPTVGSLLLACCCVGLCWWCKTKDRRKKIKLRKKYFKGRLEEQRFNQEVDNTKLFTEKQLKNATDNFNEDRIIGKGGQGTVYKGMLSDGKLIAVKRSSSLSEEQWKEFINEVIILSHVNHRNVVKLLGCCLETKTLLLVYEFIPNGTLSKLIHSPNEELQVTWEIRLRIASEVAGAIAYLHSSSLTPIYHRDIKSSNILLDHKYTAKVCDFGISRSTKMDQTHLTTCVRGTFGYLDPQYFLSNQFSEKSDVYSFGVVLVEILTGQKPTSITSDNATSLVMQFMKLTDGSAIFDMLDPIILESRNKIDDIMVVVNLAKRCLHLEGVGRPTMMQVAMELVCLNQKVYAELAGSSKEYTSDPR